LTLANGATVAIDSGYAAVATIAPRLTIFGDNAVVEVVGDDRVTVRSPDRTRRIIEVTGDERDSHETPMRRFAAVVRDAVATGNVPVRAPTFADGRACDQVLDRLRAAPFA
jgi:predicted dehydrogenase